MKAKTGSTSVKYSTRSVLLAARSRLLLLFRHWLMFLIREFSTLLLRLLYSRLQTNLQVKAHPHASL